MSAASNYVEDTIIDLFLRSGTYTGGTPYVALFTADPTDDTTTALANEASYTNYARQAGTFSASDGSSGASSNTALITFPANGDVGSVTITHAGVFDAVTNGNLLFHGALAVSKSLATGEFISFAIGDLDFTVA